MSQKPANAEFRRVTQPSLVEVVAQNLRQAILTGSLRPGQRISDARVASEMGISRAPVREAIRNLAARGLVDEEPRRGAFVTQLSHRTAHNVYDCRRALEGLAARRLADFSNLDELVKVLQGIVHEMADLSGGIASAEVDHRFHVTLCELADNAWLIRLYAQIADQSRLMQALDSFAHPSADDDLATPHQAIVDAILSANPKFAEQAVVVHIDLAEEYFLAAISNPGSASSMD
jgi:GntR family transcriptional regulator of gluconate operon